MNKQIMSKIAIEIFWWLITGLIVLLIISPLWQDFIKYKYVYNSIMYIIVFITMFRYIFLLKYTLLANFQAGKFILIFLSIPFGFYLIQEFFAFHDFLDQEGTNEFQRFFRYGISSSDLYQVLEYTTNQMLFFGIGAIMSIILLPFRLLVSYWRVHNKTGLV